MGIINHFRYHTPLGRSILLLLCSSIVFFTFAILYLLDCFLSAVHYIEFQDRLLASTMSNRVESILKNREYELFLGEKAEYLQYASFLHNYLEADDFKSAYRTMRIRKFPKSALRDELLKKSLRLKDLAIEIKLLQQTTVSSEEDTEFLLISSSADKIREKKIEIEKLKEETQELSRELLLIFSSQPPNSLHKKVYQNMKTILKSCCSVELKDFPVLPSS